MLGMNPEFSTQFDAIAARLQGQVEEINDAHMARMRDKLPDWALESDDLWQRMKEFGADSMRAELDALRRGELPETCPDVDAQGAKEGARVGGMLNALLSGYRSGQQEQWEAWLTLVENSEADQSRRRELLDRGSRFFYEYADRLSGFVTEVYSEERDRILRGTEQRRVNLVRELLEGEEVDAALLDYELSAHHTGVIGRGEEAGEAVRELAHRLDRRLLMVGVTLEAWWAWLGGDRPLDARAQVGLASFRPPAGTGVAFGTELSGSDGFRRTHRQAANAQAIARKLGLDAVRYEQVALEVLLLSDEQDAREFVARELAGIDGEDKRSVKLRATLRAYFDSGQNAAAAASALGVHEQTVAQRLRTVADRTGYEVATRRAELEVALRLERLLA
jgi:hypothetical protein